MNEWAVIFGGVFLLLLVASIGVIYHGIGRK